MALDFCEDPGKCRKYQQIYVIHKSEETKTHIADPMNSNNYSCSPESDTQHGRTEADKIFLGIYAEE